MVRPGSAFDQAMSSATGLERRLVRGGQQDRQVDEAHDRHEVLVDVVGHGHAECRVGDHRGRRQQDGVAVGFRLGDDLGADDGAAARLVLDDHRLAQQSGELLGDDAGGGVGRSARRIGHDETDGPLGKGLRAAGGAERRPSAAAPKRCRRFICFLPFCPACHGMRSLDKATGDESGARRSRTGGEQRRCGGDRLPGLPARRMALLRQPAGRVRRRRRQGGKLRAAAGDGGQPRAVDELRRRPRSRPQAISPAPRRLPRTPTPASRPGSPRPRPGSTATPTAA